jgi:hypothetical protein
LELGCSGAAQRRRARPSPSPGLSVAARQGPGVGNLLGGGVLGLLLGADPTGGAGAFIEHPDGCRLDLAGRVVLFATGARGDDAEHARPTPWPP